MSLPETRTGHVARHDGRLDVPAADTVFVGDSLKDVEAAYAAGCEAVLVRTGNGKKAEQEAAALGALVFDDLDAFSRATLKN